MSKYFGPIFYSIHRLLPLTMFHSWKNVDAYNSIPFRGNGTASSSPKCAAHFNREK